MAKAFPETTLTIDGQVYRLLLDINAQVSLEERLSTPERAVTFQAIAELALKGSATHARWLFWASLQRYHSAITVEQAGDLMSAADSDKALGEALEQTAPDSADVKDLGVKRRRPQKAQTATPDGTGGRLRSRRSPAV